MGLLTSALSSPLADIINKYGHIVQIKERGKNKPGAECAETGMMNDIFELGTLELLNSMIEAIFRKLPVGDVFRLCEEEFQKVGEMIDAHIDSETYTKLVDIMEKRTNVFFLRWKRHRKRNRQNNWRSALPY